MGGKSSPPPAPDYTQAAQATAASNQQQNTAQTWANRPTMTTPWGTSTWTSSTATDPATGQPVTQWANNVTLTPEEQAALTQQQHLQSGLSTAAASLLGRATDSFGQPWDTSHMTGLFNAGAPANLDTSGGPAGPALQRFDPTTVAGAGSAATAAGVGSVDLQRGVENNGAQLQTNIAGPGDYSDPATQAILQRQQPILNRQRAQLQTQLANQGIQQGSEAYTNALRDQGMQENDANLAAITAGINQGNTEFQQGLQQGQFKNSALGQQFTQGLQQGQFANEAGQNMFNQAATSAQVQNQAAQIQNQANQFNVSDAQFNEQQRAAANAANNSYAQQAYQDANNRYLQGNSALSQQQALNQDYSNLTLQQRQQQLAEALQARQMPLNELNAFLSGQQVQNPTFNGPNSTANRAAGTDYSGAAQQQYNAAMGGYNAQVGQQNSTMGGLYSIGSAALMAF
ncbi:MAG: hypothetical protein HY255_06665 [Betaproteobacteria bacterium]|nr:hypothetical protein [Betaproteobacteria bacterium]